MTTVFKKVGKKLCLEFEFPSTIYIYVEFEFSIQNTVLQWNNFTQHL